MTIGVGSAASAELHIRIVDGRVVCPRLGPVDLDRCRECAYLVRIDAARSDERESPCIVCSLGSGEEPDFESVSGGF